MTAYAPGKTKVRRTISQGVEAPNALAFDGSGKLYVANGENVLVYAAGTRKLVRTISRGRNESAVSVEAVICIVNTTLVGEGLSAALWFVRRR